MFQNKTVHTYLPCVLNAPPFFSASFDKLSNKITTFHDECLNFVKLLIMQFYVYICVRHEGIVSYFKAAR